jgi:phenylalanyl-tRNA synthetase beta chain
VRRKIESVRFFEIGRAFLSIEHQPIHLAGLAYGWNHTEQWGEKKKIVDFFDVKNDLQNFFKGRTLTTQRLETAHPALHPGRSAQILLDGEAIGIMGELHPQLLKTWDLSMTPILFEVELTPYVMKRSLATFRSLSDLPSVKRDLALVAPKSLPAQSVLDTVKNTGLKYLKQVELFDVFEGGTLDTQLKSLAIRLYWQPETQMLTDADIQNDVQQLLERLSCTLKVSLRT